MQRPTVHARCRRRYRRSAMTGPSERATASRSALGAGHAQEHGPCARSWQRRSPQRQRGTSASALRR
eukprot:4251263-Alexandrium_andersonii.AAC.2